MKREKYLTKQCLLGNEMNREAVILLLRNAPLDSMKPLEVVIREQVKRRGPDANALMWAGPLKDISEQAWVHGRRYSAEVWHEHFKREYLPEVFDPELCLAGYRKWDYTPNSDRVLVGSTTKLTTKGFGEYLEQVIAAGAEMGVRFSTAREE